MTDHEINIRIAIDRLVAHIRACAQDFGVTLERDRAMTIRGALEATFGAPSSESPSGRVESELLDYDPKPPYRVYISDMPEPVEFSEVYEYRRAQHFARDHSGARDVSVFIRDGANVVTWEIRLTDEPLG